MSLVEAQQLELEIAEVCGVINTATGRLVALIGRMLATGAWEGSGVRSAEHWVAWRCGVTAGRARQLVAMARRLPELSETRAALEKGELAEDQVATICRLAPTQAEASVAELARHATVSQLRRVLVDYCWESDKPERPKPAGPGAASAGAGGTEGAGGAGAATEARPAAGDAAGSTGGEVVEPRRVSFGYRDDGCWHLSARLPADEGAIVEQALEAARRTLDGERPWAEALVAVADRSLGGGAERLHHVRHTVLVHVSAKGGHLHLGPALPDTLRRYLSCDSGARAVLDGPGAATSVGRRLRIVPERTRIAVEERDRGCRVPGCDRTRRLHIHHVQAWEDGGPTDTLNLVALCAHHHRQHHLGNLGIAGGNADARADGPDGLVFTDPRGRRLTGSGRPAPPPPGAPPPQPGHWSHPSGTPLVAKWVEFPEPDQKAG